MGFLLDRNLEDFKYELFYDDQLIQRHDLLTAALDAGKDLAKNNAESLSITKACVSDWYLGFPLDLKNEVTCFYSPEGISEEVRSSHRFIEGPFETQRDAGIALRKINGQSPRKET